MKRRMQVGVYRQKTTSEDKMLAFCGCRWCRELDRKTLNQAFNYHVAFIKGPQGRIITDRRYNTAQLLDVYLGKDSVREDRITWNPADPNRVAIVLPGTGVCTHFAANAALQW